MLLINELIFKWPNSIKMEVNLEASAGKIVLINGPSGIGKTTLFNIISGFYEPVSGSVTFEGKNLLIIPSQVLHWGLCQIQNILNIQFHLKKVLCIFLQMVLQK